MYYVNFYDADGLSLTHYLENGLFRDEQTKRAKEIAITKELNIKHFEIIKENAFTL